MPRFSSSLLRKTQRFDNLSMAELQSKDELDVSALGTRKIVHVDMDAFYASV